MPARPFCVVSCCNQQPSEGKQFFFNFPKRKEYFDIWTKNLKLEYLRNMAIQKVHNAGYRVCSKHFLDKHFQNNLKRKLNRNAIPTPVDDTVNSLKLNQQIPNPVTGTDDENGFLIHPEEVIILGAPNELVTPKCTRRWKRSKSEEEYPTNVVEVEVLTDPEEVTILSAPVELVTPKDTLHWKQSKSEEENPTNVSEVEELVSSPRTKMKTEIIPSENLQSTYQLVSFPHKTRHLNQMKQEEFLGKIFCTKLSEDIHVTRSDMICQSEDSEISEKNKNDKFYKDKYEQLLEKYEQLEMKLDHLKNDTKSMNFNVRRLQRKLIYYKSKKISNKRIELQVKKVLSNMFTKSQLNILLKKKKKLF